MANKKINQLDSRVLSSTDLMLIGDPTTGISYKSLISGLGLVYVPYTGATANIALGEYGISGGYFQADLTPTMTGGIGRLIWNDSDGTLDLGLKGGNVTLQIGQEQVQRVVNKSGINLLESAYQVVKVTSAQGQRLAVDLAQGNNDLNSTDTIGIVTETINNNQEGFITTSGIIRGINTTGSLQGETWVDGDIIYLSPTIAGAITKVKPTAPNHSVILGYVVYAHGVNGKIFVKCDNGYEIGELHDVYAPTPSNNDGIFWNSTNLRYENKTIATALGFTPVPTTRTIGTTAPLTGGGDLSANRTLSIPAATTLVDGYLTATDWTTFNNKQNALGFTPVPTTRTLTINGTTFDLSANRSWTVGTVTGSGVAGQVAYWDGTSSQTGSNNLFWDAANSRLGIGTNAPASSLDIVTSNPTNATFISDSSFITNLILQKNLTPGNNDGFSLSFRRSDGTIASPTNVQINRGLGYINYTGYHTGAYRLAGGIRTAVDGSTSSTSMPMRFEFLTSNDGSVTPTIKMMLKNNGNLLLQDGGTFTDSGQRLQVQGDAFIKGSGATSASYALLVQNSAGTQMAQFRNDQYIQIGSATSTLNLPTFISFGAVQLYPINNGNYAVSSTATELRFDTTFSGVTTGNFGYAFGTYSAHNTSHVSPNSVIINGSFSPTSGTQTFSNTLFNPTINQTGGANGITRGLYIFPTLTAAADWRSIEWSNNSGWGLYGAGTANNYLGGDLTFGNNKGFVLSQPGINRSVNVLASVILDNFAGLSLYPSQGTNVANSISIIPKGAGFSGSVKSQLLIYNTDSIADSTNFEAIILRAAGNSFTFATGKGGTGTIRPLLLSSGFLDGTTNANQLWLYTSGRVGVNTISESTFTFDVNGTARVIGNTKIGNTILSNNATNLIIGVDGSPSQVILANNSNYQDFNFISTSISSGNINSWGFGQRRDTYFGNAIGSFQIVGSYTDNTGTGSMVGGGYRVPLICNPNGDVIISGASANAINGNVSIGSTTISTSAKLSVTSTTQGFLPPRMTTTQKNAISTPAAGLQVYDTTLNQMSYYNGTTWINF